MRNLVVVLAVLMAACGGDDGGGTDERVSCDASWDAKYGSLETWDGTCVPGCEAYPAVEATCQIEGRRNGEPGLVDCNDFGAGVDIGGQTVCCILTATNPDDIRLGSYVGQIPCV